MSQYPKYKLKTASFLPNFKSQHISIHNDLVPSCKVTLKFIAFPVSVNVHTFAPGGFSE